MKRIVLFGLVSCLCLSAFAEPELTGSPEELTQYLDSIPATVRITGESEIKAQFQAVAGAVDKFPEIAFEGIGFERADETELKQKAIAQACEAAVRKKDLFENKLGIKLTARRFEQGFVGQQRPIRVDEMPSKFLATSSIANVRVDVHEPSTAAGSQFDELVFKATLSVDYRLTNP